MSARSSPRVLTAHHSSSLANQAAQPIVPKNKPPNPFYHKRICLTHYTDTINQATRPTQPKLIVIKKSYLWWKWEMVLSIEMLFLNLLSQTAWPILLKITRNLAIQPNPWLLAFVKFTFSFFLSTYLLWAIIEYDVESSWNQDMCRLSQSRA